MDSLVQGSPEWFQARAGKITASRLGKLMAKTKSGWSTSRANMISQLAIERITGVVETSFQSSAMQRGTDMEPEAKAAYSFEYGVAVIDKALCVHPELPYCTCSPDGLIGDDGLVEIKCPDAMAKHFSYLKDGKHAAEYKWQLGHQLFVTGREWVDVVSYDPRYPQKIQLAVKRVFREPELMEEIKESVIQCEVLIQEQVAAMTALMEA